MRWGAEEVKLYNRKWCKWGWKTDSKEGCDHSNDISCPACDILSDMFAAACFNQKPSFLSSWMTIEARYSWLNHEVYAGFRQSELKGAQASVFGSNIQHHAVNVRKGAWHVQAASDTLSTAIKPLSTPKNDRFERVTYFMQAVRLLYEKQPAVNHKENNYFIKPRIIQKLFCDCLWVLTMMTDTPAVELLCLGAVLKCVLSLPVTSIFMLFPITTSSYKQK